jgi:hypothetical protein
VLSVFTFGVHDHTEDFNVLFRLDYLSFDSEWLSVRLVRLAGKVDDPVPRAELY